MLQRCLNPKNKAFKNYGARGIAVCDRWRLSFDAFFADVGRRPGKACSLERIDNDRGYEPGNCRWATTAEQRRNSRQNVYVQVGGERLCVMDAARLIGITLQSLYCYRHNHALSYQEAVDDYLGGRVRRA